MLWKVRTEIAILYIKCNKKHFFLILRGKHELEIPEEKFQKCSVSVSITLCDELFEQFVSLSCVDDHITSDTFI